MPNRSSPYGTRYRGWFYDAVNNRLEYFFNGTKVGHIDGSGQSITNDTTARMTNGQVTSAGIGANAVVNTSLVGSAARQYYQRASAAAIASNGADALVGLNLYASANLVIDSVWAVNLTGSDVTKGTATSSASYRRVQLVCNTAATGTGTDIVASLNATASAAAGASRGFTVAASTVPAGGIVLASQLTVGAATGDGTDAAAREYVIAYHYA